jgi:hypothetical protein
MSSNNNSNPPTGVNSALPTTNNNNNLISLTSNQLLPVSSSNNSVSPTSTQSSITLGPLYGSLPNGIRIIERTVDGAFWPAELILDLGKANWFEWNRKLKLLVLQHGLKPWLEGTLPCPDPLVSADAHYIWTHNDDVLSGFILGHISTVDVIHVESCQCTTAHDLFVTLRTLHENHGTHTQISLLMKALEIRFSHDTPLRDTLAEVRGYYRRITAMGKITDDVIFTVILLHSMSGHFTHLQQAVQNMAQLPNFNSDMVAKRILDEDALIRRRLELGQPANPTAHLSLSNQSASPIAALNSRQRRPQADQFQLLM